MCKLSHHVCANDSTICLPAEKLCDGADDCPDGSDEKLCGKEQHHPGYVSLQGTQRSKWRPAFKMIAKINQRLSTSVPFYLQTCVRWTTASAAITAQWLPERGSFVPVLWAWSWGLTTRLVRSRASALNTWSAVNAASRTSSVSYVRATTAGNWSLTRRIARARVRDHGNKRQI